MWQFVIGVICGLGIAYPQEAERIIHAGFVAAHDITMRVVEWAQTIPNQ